jgi:tetratricopeptide (TPR) repeat protein
MARNKPVSKSKSPALRRRGLLATLNVREPPSLRAFSILSAAWTVLLYWRALANAFVYDDILQIVENPKIRTLGSALEYFVTAVPFSSDYLTGAGSFYRPLFWISLSLDYQLWGGDAFGFHLTNLVLHWLNGVLVFLLLRRGGAPWPLVFGAPLVWLAVPANAEVVAWVSARPFSIATLFGCLGALALHGYLETRRAGSAAVFAVALLCALLAHEIGVLLPLVSLLLFWRRARVVPSRTVIATALALSGFVIGFYVVLRALAGAQGPPMTTAHLLSWFPQAAVIPVKYAQMVLYPGHFSVERSSELNEPATIASITLAWVAVAGSIIAGIVLRKSVPWFATGLLWFGVGMLPFLNVLPLYQGLAERYVYFASGGLVIGLGALLLAMAQRDGTVTKVIVVCIGSAWLAWSVTRLDARVLDWRDEWSLYRSSLVATPRSYVLLYNLAVKYAQSGQASEAEALYRKALALQPAYASAKINLANLLQRRGGYDAAERLYREVLATQPGRKDALLNLGNLYQRAGRAKEAETAYVHALGIDPQYVEAALNLGALYQTTGRMRDARTAYEKVLSLNPSHAVAHLNLGVLLYHDYRFGQSADGNRQLEVAIRHLTRAIEFEPSYAEAHFNLGVIYHEMGDLDRARASYLRALDVNPNYSKARTYLEMLATSGR